MGFRAALCGLCFFMRRFYGGDKKDVLRKPVFEFMARVLYYGPDHHEISIRYYGLYSSTYRGARKRKTVLWHEGIQHSSQAEP